MKKSIIILLVIIGCISQAAKKNEKSFENNMSTLSLKETRFANKLSVLALIVSAFALLVSIFR